MEILFNYLFNINFILATLGSLSYDEFKSFSISKELDFFKRTRKLDYIPNKNLQEKFNCYISDSDSDSDRENNLTSDRRVNNDRGDLYSLFSESENNPKKDLDEAFEEIEENILFEINSQMFEIDNINYENYEKEKEKFADLFKLRNSDTSTNVSSYKLDRKTILDKINSEGLKKLGGIIGKGVHENILDIFPNLASNLNKLEEPNKNRINTAVEEKLFEFSEENEVYKDEFFFPKKKTSFKPERSSVLTNAKIHYISKRFKVKYRFQEAL